MLGKASKTRKNLLDQYKHQLDSKYVQLEEDRINEKQEKLKEENEGTDIVKNMHSQEFEYF